MRPVFLALAALILATPAAAQDGSQDVFKRTPENAHMFLNQAMVGTKSGLTASNPEAAGLNANTPLIWLDVVKWSNSTLCLSRSDLGASPGGTIQTPNGTGTYGAIAASANAIDWTSVTEIRPSGSDLVLATKGVPFIFRTSSETMATRIGAAMQLLVDSCDPARDSGF